MGDLLIGCSGWSYGDTPEKGGWVGVFYPSKDTKRLRLYSQFFNTAEMDSIFYEKFYSHMTKEFLARISPLKSSNKLGAILLQLPPSFTVTDFKNIEGFLPKTALRLSVCS
jgi:uncharacterized protein YecE (DUF72 family)